MFTKAYLKKLGERALTTFASALSGLLVGTGAGLLDVAWSNALSVAGMSTLVAVLVSVAGGAATTSNGPELVSRDTELLVAKKAKGITLGG